MSKLLISEHPLQVLPSLAVAIGLNEAIVLQQIHYWLAKASFKKNGHTWVYNTVTQWQAQFPFWSDNTVRRTLANLKQRGLLVGECLGSNGFDKTMYYRIDYKVLDSLDDANLESSKAPSQNVTLDDANLESSTVTKLASSTVPERHLLLDRTETTSETTSETKTSPSASAPEVCAVEPAASELAAEPVRSAPAEQKAVADHQGVDPAFEAAWSLYPARSGNARHMALGAWKARVTEGVSVDALLTGAKNYATHCQRQKIHPKFVMTAGRFFSAEGHYAADWAVPVPAGEQLPFFDDGDYSNTVTPI